MKSPEEVQGAFDSVAASRIGHCAQDDSLFFLAGWFRLLAASNPVIPSTTMLHDTSRSGLRRGSPADKRGRLCGA